MLSNANALQDAASVPRDLIELIVALLNLTCLEALKQAVNAQVDLVFGVSLVAEVDLGQILASPELVVGCLDVLLVGDVLCYVLTHSKIFLFNDLIFASVAASRLTFSFFDLREAAIVLRGRCE